MSDVGSARTALAPIIAVVLLALAIVASAPLAGARLARRGGGGPSAVEPVPEPKLAATAAPPAADLVGVIVPPATADLSPRVASRVKRVNARLGEAVVAGQILVAFDLREARQELTAARARLFTARAEAAGARAESAAARDRARRRDSAEGVFSGEDIAQSRLDVQRSAARSAAAQGRIAELQAEVERLSLAVEEGEVRAPFDGRVTALAFGPGMLVRPGEIVARVVGGEGLRARVAVPEERAVALRGATHILFRVGADELTATVEQVSPEVDAASRAFVVEGPVLAVARLCAATCTELTGREIRARLVAIDPTDARVRPLADATLQR